MAFIDTEYLKGSDGTGPAVLARVESNRAIGSTVLDVDNVGKWNSKVIVTVGTLLPSGQLNPATITEFRGRVVAGDIIIDSFEPGFADVGNLQNQVAIIKQTTGWANSVVEELQALKAEDLTRSAATTSNFVSAGGIWTLVSGLNGSMTALTAYISSYRNTIAAIASRAFTASKDTYVDILRNPTTNVFTLVYTEVANNAASPVLAANSMRIAKVVTSGAAITSVVQTYRDSLGNYIYPEGAVGHSNLQVNGLFEDSYSATGQGAAGEFTVTDRKVFDVSTIPVGHLFTVFARCYSGDANTRNARSRVFYNGITYEADQFASYHITAIVSITLRKVAGANTCPVGFGGSAGGQTWQTNLIQLN